MDPEYDDGLGPSNLLGLGKILLSAGVDVGEFTNAFDKSGSGSSVQANNARARAFAEIEDSDEEAGYMDDDADIDMDDTGESMEERATRERAAARARADEERWMKRGMEMQRQAESAAKKKISDRIKDEQEGRELTPLEKIRKVWPDWQPGQKMRLSEVFYQSPVVRDREEVDRKKRKLAHFGVAQRDFVLPEETKFTLSIAPSANPPPESFFSDPSLPDLFIRDITAPLYLSGIGAFFDPEWIRAAKQLRRDAMVQEPTGLERKDALMWGDEGRPLDLMAWEDDIVYSAKVTEGQGVTINVPGVDGDRRASVSLKIKKTGEPKSKQPKKAIPTLDPLRPRNTILDTDSWANEIIWDATRVSSELFAGDNEDDLAIARDLSTKAVQAKLKPKPKLDACNFSNDHLYEHTREARNKIRQTFGAIEVFHSAPAKALQMPWYKTSLSKHEARSWKRPALQFPVGVPITISKTRPNPIGKTARKKMMADPSERFPSTKELTMAEKGNFVLLEFSEEYPPIMSGYGMGTTMVNYYRKKDDNDTTVPSLPLGQPSILNVGDAEPFLLGYVDKGSTTQVLHNNLIRAPIFRHSPPTSDFLVVRHTVNGQSNYYIRSINHMYTVGQTVPNESEVPGPHARKNTSYARIRLQIVAWLLINKNKDRRIKIGKLLKYFPDQSELQMRQRLKIKGQEFLVFNRATGAHQGYWQLNPNMPFEWPDERQEVLEQVTPEQAMLFEGMQVGARHLYDAGYTKTAEGKDAQNEEEENALDVEQKLAVWSTTLNYKKAEQAKAWLVVHGDGDPTGRGEGWSFLKGNMKGYFLRRGETEQGRRIEAEHKSNGGIIKISNAEQNRIYDEEKRRIWDLQYASLSNPTPPELDARDDDAYASAGTPGLGWGVPYGGGASAAGGSRFGRSDSRRAFSRSNSMAATPYADSPMPMGRDASPAPSMDESTFTGNNPLANKVLRIRRIVRGKSVVEVVRDPAVIASYKRRVDERRIETFKTELETLAPTGDYDDDARKRTALMEELENLRRNQARRAARRKYANQAKIGKRQPGDTGDEGPSNADPTFATKEPQHEGQRKCGACGLYGHTKANRYCEKFKYNQFTGGRASIAESPVSSTPGPTPGGFGGTDYFASTQVGAGTPGSGGGAGDGAGGGGGGGGGAGAGAGGQGGRKEKEEGKLKIRLGGFGR